MAGSNEGSGAEGRGRPVGDATLGGLGTGEGGAKDFPARHV